MKQIMIYTHPPRDWQVFQNLIFDLSKIKFIENSVIEYGRLGQRQNGVDVFAKDRFEKCIGLQCKETKGDNLPQSDIEDECAKVIKFVPKIDCLIFCTTLRSDTDIQDTINHLNESKKYPFTLQVWFWDEINLELNKFSNLIFTLYADYAAQFGIDDIQRHLTALRSAFDRPAFHDNFLHERNYNDFEEAISSTKQLIRTGILCDRITRTVISQVVPCDLIVDVKYKKFLMSIERSLESIYKVYISNKTAILRDHNQAASFAGVFNVSRKKLIGVINKKLHQHKLQEIAINY